jgi:hypothetical protein
MICFVVPVGLYKLDYLIILEQTNIYALSIGFPPTINFRPFVRFGPSEPLRATVDILKAKRNVPHVAAGTRALSSLDSATPVLHSKKPAATRAQKLSATPPRQPPPPPGSMPRPVAVPEQIPPGAPESRHHQNEAPTALGPRSPRTRRTRAPPCLSRAR